LGRNKRIKWFIVALVDVPVETKQLTNYRIRNAYGKPDQKQKQSIFRLFSS